MDIEKLLKMVATDKSEPEYDVELTITKSGTDRSVTVAGSLIKELAQTHGIAALMETVKLIKLELDTPVGTAKKSTKGKKKK